MASDISAVLPRERLDTLIAALGTAEHPDRGPAGIALALQRGPIGLQTGASIETIRSDCLPAEMETNNGC